MTDETDVDAVLTAIASEMDMVEPTVTVEVRVARQWVNAVAACVRTDKEEPPVQGPATTDRDTLQKVAEALLDMHGEHRVADSPTARMVLRRIGYIMSGMPPEVAEKMERMFRHESR